MRSRVKVSTDPGSVFWSSTFTVVSPTGSQGRASGSVKPAPGALRQGIGVRMASRPA